MSNLSLRPTTSDDLPFVFHAEQHPDNRPFIIPWNEQQHQVALQDPDLQHLVLVTQSGMLVGFVILAGLTSVSESIEFRRLVISEKRQGYGRTAVQLVQSMAFEQHAAHRLWLDVKEHNRGARQLYTHEGFTVEGVLRECLKSGDGYESLVIMSMLRREYLKKHTSE